MSLSSILLNDFEINILNKTFDEVKIGRCFLNNLNLIKDTYAHYAQFIEFSNNTLEKVSVSIKKINLIHTYLNFFSKERKSC